MAFPPQGKQPQTKKVEIQRWWFEIFVVLFLTTFLKRGSEKWYYWIDVVFSKIFDCFFGDFLFIMRCYHFVLKGHDKIKHNRTCNQKKGSFFDGDEELWLRIPRLGNNKYWQIYGFRCVFTIACLSYPLLIHWFYWLLEVRFNIFRQWSWFKFPTCLINIDSYHFVLGDFFFHPQKRYPFGVLRVSQFSAFRAMRASASNSTMLWTLWTSTKEAQRFEKNGVTSYKSEVDVPKCVFRLGIVAHCYLYFCVIIYGCVVHTYLRAFIPFFFMSCKFK